jgi:hypothetical protein
MVTAQACGQPSCVTLRPSISVDSATVHLPKSVTVQAPQSAMYGYRYSIKGAAGPGDQVALQGLSNDGLVEARGSAAVRPDGSFVIRTTLHSAFSDDGDLVLPARGRYGVASTEGGNATVYGIATEDTRVTLAQPRLVLKRKPGNKLHFAIRVPGGDQHVRVAIKLGTKTLAKGYATPTGRFFKTIVKPHSTGNLRAVVSVPGADTASRHQRLSASDPVRQSEVVLGPPRMRRPHWLSRCIRVMLEGRASSSPATAATPEPPRRPFCSRPRPPESSVRLLSLVRPDCSDLAGDSRKRLADVGAEKSDRSNDGDRDHCEDDRVFGHRLTALTVGVAEVEVGHQVRDRETHVLSFASAGSPALARSASSSSVSRNTD